MQISYADLRDKILGCWSGKNVGGVLGEPYEGRSHMTQEVTFYKQDINGNPPPNDDLDLQLVWLHAAEQYGSKVNSHILASYWMNYIVPNWSEYGLGKRNLRAGMLPPLSGGVNNPYKDSNGSWIRTELWACLAPGNPELAVRYAYEDAIVDHADEGVYATAFVAALESAAFVVSDKNTLLDIGLSYIPENSLVARAVRCVRASFANGMDWKAAKDELFRAYPGSFGITFDKQKDIEAERLASARPGMDAPNNIGIIVLAWLYGEDDFGKSLCMAVNCGEDTDCTAATLGSIFGIQLGNQRLPEKWTKPLAGVINTCCIDLATKVPVPKTIDELTDRVIACIPKMNDCKQVRFEDGGIAVTAADNLSCPDEHVYIPHIAGHGKSKRIPIQALLALSPYGVKYEFGSMGVVVDYMEEPYIQPNVPKKIKLILWDANRFNTPGQWADVRIYADDGIQLAGGRFLSAPLMSTYSTKTEFEIEFTAETITAPTVNLVFDITVRGFSTNALVKASFYPGKHKEV